VPAMTPAGLVPTSSAARSGRVVAMSLNPGTRRARPGFAETKFSATQHMVVTGSDNSGWLTISATQLNGQRTIIFYPKFNATQPKLIMSWPVLMCEGQRMIQHSPASVIRPDRQLTDPSWHILVL